MKYFEGQPFQFIGVNEDFIEDLPRLEQQHRTTWRSFADGRGGPIASQWRAEALPATFVIDHRGVIRAKNPGKRELANIVLSLVEEAELAKRRG